MPGLKAMLLLAPDHQLDAQMFPLIEKWDEPSPKAIQVLEVLDHCMFSSLASGLVVSVLQAAYNDRLKSEGTTHDEVVKGATWRG